MSSPADLLKQLNDSIQKGPEADLRAAQFKVNTKDLFPPVDFSDQKTGQAVLSIATQKIVNQVRAIFLKDLDIGGGFVSKMEIQDVVSEVPFQQERDLFFAKKVAEHVLAIDLDDLAQIPEEDRILMVCAMHRREIFGQDLVTLIDAHTRIYKTYEPSSAYYTHLSLQIDRVIQALAVEDLEVLSHPDEYSDQLVSTYRKFLNNLEKAFGNAHEVKLTIAEFIQGANGEYHAEAIGLNPEIISNPLLAISTIVHEYFHHIDQGAYGNPSEAFFKDKLWISLACGMDSAAGGHSYNTDNFTHEECRDYQIYRSLPYEKQARCCEDLVQSKLGNTIDRYRESQLGDL